MHNNYHFFRRLTESLFTKINETVVSECFSQNKDELVLRFESRNEPFFIKASLEPVFTCLSFPDNFQRARKNSVDLFGELIGRKVSGIRVYEHERSFSIAFDGNITLLFKMHGNRANLILFEDNDIISLFRNSIAGDLSIALSTLNRHIDWSYENFAAHQDNLRATFFTLGKIPWHYLNDQEFEERSVKEKWNMFSAMLKEMETSPFYITRVENTVSFSLLPVGQIEETFTDPLRALTSFYYRFTQLNAFSTEKNEVLSVLHTRLKSTTAFHNKTTTRIREIQEDTNYKIWADLIMANLHAIKTGEEKVVLENFYHDNLPTEIKLKRNLTPQKNAELFYRKSKNQQGEIQRLQQQADRSEKELANLYGHLVAANSAADLKAIRSLRNTLGIDEAREKKQETLPYRETVFHGFRIMIGKNAQSNDELTLRYGYKEDLWLHAKDVSGSHVLIKYQAGKKFPKDVIEYAAQLAAFFSKRKNESLCPVAYTSRKYVRKRKGDPAGAVVVEREEVILVEPKSMRPESMSQ